MNHAGEKEVTRWWWVPTVLAIVFIIGTPILIGKETGSSYYTYSGNFAMSAWLLMVMVDVVVYLVRFLMRTARSWIVVWPLIFIVEILYTQLIVLSFLPFGCMPHKPCF